MKILQLNIWGGKLGKQIEEVLKREQPDIVCFQEVVSLPRISERFFSPLEKFQQSGGFAHTFYSPTFGFTLMSRQAEFGNAILSTLPFISTNTMFTRKTYVENQDLLDDDYNIQNLQHAAIEHNGQTLHILNHHGHHVREHKNGNEETMRQCGEIADYIKTLNGLVVLTGDFNLAPDSESLEQINAVLVNHAKELGVLTTRTPLTHKTEVCDYIFTSSDIAVTDFQVLDDIASDHKALVVEF
mgnify:CR=1 FL=1